MLIWCRATMWFLLSVGIWGSRSGGDAETTRLALASLKSQLSAWYSSAAPRDVTQISKLTLKMIGTKANQALKLKAMETYGFLLFLTDALLKHRGKLGTDGDMYYESGLCLVKYVDLVKSAPVNVPVSTQQDVSRTNGGRFGEP